MGQMGNPPANRTVSSRKSRNQGQNSRKRPTSTNSPTRTSKNPPIPISKPMDTRPFDQSLANNRLDPTHQTDQTEKYRTLRLKAEAALERLVDAEATPANVRASAARTLLELVGEQELRGPMPFLEDPAITTAWLLLARGDEVSVAQGQALLSHLLQHVESQHNTRKTIKVLALQAWAYDLQGRESEALEVLERALALARPGGFIRTFADVAPLSKVLQALRKRRRMQLGADKQLDSYLHRIQVAMSPLASAPGSKKELLRQEGLEPLTERELHILHFLDQDLTNREIARELVVTPGTVKVHTTNVYRKLSVNNRHAAVTLARSLGLLAAN